MTEVDLDALEATARAATQGEWHYRPTVLGMVNTTVSVDDGTHVAYPSVCHALPSNATHIAAFDPPTALALIARLREAEAVIEATEDWVTAHYLDTHMGEKVLELLSRYKPTKTEGETK